MQSTRAGVLFCVLMLIAGCGGDDGTSPPSQDEPLAESTVGGGGGTLDAGGFTLAVPAAAFAADADLALYEASASGLPDDSATGVFKLAGLPDEIGEALTLTLGCPTPPDGDPLIAVGREITPVEGEPFIDFTYVEATHADGELTGDWQPAAAEGAAKSDAAYAYFFGPRTTRQIPVRSDDEDETYLYLINFPPEGVAHVDAFADSLEQAYQRYSALGFDFTRPHQPGVDCFPIEVKFDGATPPANRYVVDAKASPWSSEPAGRMTFYRDRLSPSEIEALTTAAGAALGQLVLQGQIPHAAGVEADMRHLDWLYAAFGLWAESLFASDPDHVPALFDAGGLDLEFGLVNGVQDTSADRHAFGRAAAALLAFLSEEEGGGVDLMLRVCDALRTGAEAGPAFLEAITFDSSAWWPDFLDSLLSGETYDAPSGAFLEQAVSLAMNEADWEAAPTGAYPDLSARLYRLDPAYADWEDGTYLDIEVLSGDVNPDHLEALVFTLDGGDLELLARGREVQVSGLEDMHDDGVDLLVAVVNSAWSLPSTGDAQITLDLEVGRSDLSGFTRVTLWSAADVLVAGEGWQAGGNYMAPASTRDGTWNGNTLTVDLAYEDGATRDTGSIVLTIDPDTGDIESFSGTIVHEQFDLELVVYREVTGVDLPYAGVEYDNMVWRRTGADACTSLTGFYRREEYGGVVDEEWTDFDCHDGEPMPSIIEIVLSNPLD